jgi:hypothetical protein
MKKAWLRCSEPREFMSENWREAVIVENEEKIGGSN